MLSFLADITMLAYTLEIKVYEWLYFTIFIASAVAVYMVLVVRIGDELPRSTVDKIFFLMLGVISLIWILSKVAPSMA